MIVWLLSGLLIVGFGTLGFAKVLAASAMRQRAARLGFTVSTYRGIGALELAGAAGLLVAIAAPVLGVLAATGLLLLLAGALVAHARHRDTFREAGPAVAFALVDAAYLGLSVAALH